MGLLHFSFKLSTWAFVLALVAFAILLGATLLKHIIPNDGEGDLVEISEGAFSIAKWGAFFTFLIFFILMVITGLAEYVTQGQVTDPVVSGCINFIMWVADKIELLRDKAFGTKFQFDPEVGGMASSSSVQPPVM